MERDNLVTHGAGAMLKDRLMEQSDPFTVPICETCGNVAIKRAPPDVGSVLHRTEFCRVCQSNSNISNVKVPYAFKLLNQELQALHINARFELEDN